MQIIYAAPFLLIAAICFFVCAAIRPFRRHALVVPFGVLSFGVGSIVAYFIYGLIIDKLGYHGPANWFSLIPYIGGGLLVAIVCSALYRMIVAILPKWMISVGLLTATFASSLALLAFSPWAIAHLIAVDYVPIGWIFVPGLMIATVVSWRVLRISEDFRPDPCLKWIVTRILPHPKSTCGNEPTI